MCVYTLLDLKCNPHTLSAESDPPSGYISITPHRTSWVLWPGKFQYGSDIASDHRE